MDARTVSKMMLTLLQNSSDDLVKIPCVTAALALECGDEFRGSTEWNIMYLLRGTSVLVKEGLTAGRWHWSCKVATLDQSPIVEIRGDMNGMWWKRTNVIAAIEALHAYDLAQACPMLYSYQPPVRLLLD